MVEQVQAAPHRDKVQTHKKRLLVCLSPLELYYRTADFVLQCFNRLILGDITCFSCCDIAVVLFAASVLVWQPVSARDVPQKALLYRSISAEQRLLLWFALLGKYPSRYRFLFLIIFFGPFPLSVARPYYLFGRQ